MVPFCVLILSLSSPFVGVNSLGESGEGGGIVTAKTAAGVAETSAVTAAGGF